jgi:DNA processing protein
MTVPVCAPDDVVLARVAWSRLVEPGDAMAGAVIAALGPVEALSWLRRAAELGSAMGAGGRDLGSLEASPELSGMGDRAKSRLAASVARWSTRLNGLDPRRDLRAIRRMGGTVLVPEGGGWPIGLSDLGCAEPACLWVRGSGDLASLLNRSVAVIGARACTGYGEHVTSDLVCGLATAGWTVVSGGAYGIDAMAHRTALAVPGPTVAFLAGGVDRLYPAGNARLLVAIQESGGAVVGEMPPGSVPSKVRFLQRNRLIAAVSRATVVVEAAWRSGAMSTATHAAGLLRPVGAVPGPVTSAASAGCHRLLREGCAVCVTDAAETLELVGAVGRDLAEEPPTPARPSDGLPVDVVLTLDALPVRRSVSPETISRSAGLTLAEVLSALGRLELAGLATHRDGLWRHAPWPAVLPKDG